MRGTELVLAIAVVGILAMMIVPVPALLLEQVTHHLVEVYGVTRGDGWNTPILRTAG